MATTHADLSVRTHGFLTQFTHAMLANLVLLELSGSASGISSTTAALRNETSKNDLAGDVTGISSATATMWVERALGGSIASTGAANAALSVQQTNMLSGIVSATSGASAAMQYTVVLVGDASSAASLDGQLSCEVQFSGAVTAISSATAAIVLQLFVSAAVFGHSDVSGMEQMGNLLESDGVWGLVSIRAVLFVEDTTGVDMKVLWHRGRRATMYKERAR